MAPLGAPGTARRRPEQWLTVPFFQVSDRNGRIEQVGGEIPEREGRYIPWLSTRLGLGAVGDTVVVLTLADAMLSAYLPSASSDGATHLWSRHLPIYFVPPHPNEEVRDLSWIQIDGTLRKLVHVPQVAAVTFGPAGKVYAIRNYMAVWQRYQDAYFQTQGDWLVTERGLEVYDHRGTLLGAYGIPDDNVRWFQADGHGRLFFGTTRASVVVARDPTFRGEGCPELPSRVLINLADRPFDGR